MNFPAAHYPAGAKAEADRSAGDAPGVHDVLMLGWEFPPFISGGLGTACYGLTRAMSRRGDRVLFVMPGPARMGFSAAYEQQNGLSQAGDGIRMADFENVEFHGINVALGDPYARLPVPAVAGSRQPAGQRDSPGMGHEFTSRAIALALQQRGHGKHFDVVHAHDWMTFQAGSAVAEALGVPLVAHVHSTEFDRRAGEKPDPLILAAEGAGLEAADAIIAVSRYTQQLLVTRYGIAPERITVIHNALELENRLAPERPVQIGADERVVLFVGRMTLQKGPELFVRAAARVVVEERAVRFVMAGTGEQFAQVRQLARQLGIEQHFLFTGFLRGEDIDALYRSADLFVMPSLSEPFGLVSLEASGRDVPVIVSKQSGAAEVLEHALKVDFWDVEETASRILSVLRDDTLAGEMAARGSFDVRQMRWSDAAEGVARVYDRLLRPMPERRV